MKYPNKFLLYTTEIENGSICVGKFNVAALWWCVSKLCSSAEVVNSNLAISYLFPQKGKCEKNWLNAYMGWKATNNQFLLYYMTESENGSIRGRKFSAAALKSTRVETLP